MKKTKKLGAASLVVMLMLSLAGVMSTGVASAQDTTATPFEQVVVAVQPSVVYLDITWTGWVYDTYNKGYLNKGQPFTLYFSCTGFFVNDEGYIGTAGHCVDPKNVLPDFLDVAAQWAVDTGYYGSHPNFATARSYAETDYRIEGDSKGAGGAYKRAPDLDIQARWSTSSTEPLYDAQGNLTGTPYGARVIQYLPWNDGAGDTALIKVDATNTPALLVATSDSVSTGEDVVSIGYPADVGAVSDANLSSPSFKEGSISSIRTNALYPVYEMDASLSGGMSGGPTVNFNGEVVGINSYGIVGNDHEFNFVQASSTLTEVMTNAGVENTLGEPGTSYQAGIDAYFAGDKDLAIKNLTIAAPDVELAQEYLVKAQALPDPKPIVPIAIGGVVVLILLGGGLFLVIRSKKNKPVAETPVVPATPRFEGGPEKHCTNCGAVVGAVSFCGECGAKQE